MADWALFLNGRWLDEAPDAALHAWANTWTVPVPWEIGEVHPGDVFLFTLGNPRRWAGVAVLGEAMDDPPPGVAARLRSADRFTFVHAEVLEFPAYKRRRVAVSGIPDLRRRSMEVREEVALRALDEHAPRFVGSEYDIGRLSRAIGARALREARAVAMDHYRSLPTFRAQWDELTERTLEEEDRDYAFVLPPTPAEATIRQIESFYRKVFLIPHAQLRDIGRTLERLEGGDGPIVIGEAAPGHRPMLLSDLIQADRWESAPSSVLSSLGQLATRAGEG